MAFDDNTTKIILAGISILALIFGGAWISKKKSKSRNTKTHQEGIRISGNHNKVVGGDDNSGQK